MRKPVSPLPSTSMTEKADPKLDSETRVLRDDELENVSGGHRPDGSPGGNITAKYDLVKAKGA